LNYVYIHMRLDNDYSVELVMPLSSAKNFLGFILSTAKELLLLSSLFAAILGNPKLAYR
jgi:hypothetical protein